MKGGPVIRTKVVLRHLPPSISKSNLVEQIDSCFAGRYSWFCFCPGKNSQKHLKHSRAYIDFDKPDDVIEFAEFFNGHVFVNEKGTQFKAIVEYAPSQRAPKQLSKKDGREGTILKDPEFLEFLEYITKPVENLPSAEIQLERKEAERAGAPKDVPIVTPLMDYVRQKRVAKSGPRRILVNGKTANKGNVVSSRTSVSGSSKRGLEKRRTSTTKYVLRDISKITKDDKVASTNVDTASVLRNEPLEGETGGSVSTESGKKILLLKGSQKEIPNHDMATLPKPSHSEALLRQNQRRESSGRIIKSVLTNKDARQDQSPSISQSEPRIFISNHIRDRRSPRFPSIQSPQKDNEVSEDKILGNNSNAIRSDKQERRTRNRDRPDRGVWAPFRRPDGLNASAESLSSSGSHNSQPVDSAEGTHVETKGDLLVTHGGAGSYRHVNRRASVYNVKDADGSVVDGRVSRKGSSGYSSHEKQVWVQKSSSPT